MSSDCDSNSHNKMDNLKIIVFDLDYTLWPFWVDTHYDPPFRKDKKGVIDSRGSTVKPYPEATEVLRDCYAKGYQLAVASRTAEIDGAKQLTRLFDWDKYFSYREIFPGKKTNHFDRISRMSGVPYSQMIFFDDEHRNIRDVQELGVVSILVENGVNKKVLSDGLRRFAEFHNK